MSEVRRGAQATQLAAIEARLLQLRNRKPPRLRKKRRALIEEIAKNERWLEQWRNLDVARAEVTLHVGARHRQ